MSDEQDQTEILRMKTRARPTMRLLQWGVVLLLFGLLVGVLVVGGGFVAHLVAGGWELGWQLAGWAMGK